MTGFLVAYLLGAVTTAPLTIWLFTRVLRALALYVAPDVSHQFGDAP